MALKKGKYDSLSNYLFRRNGWLLVITQSPTCISKTKLAKESATYHITAISNESFPSLNLVIRTQIPTAKYRSVLIIFRELKSFLVNLFSAARKNEGWCDETSSLFRHEYFSFVVCGLLWINTPRNLLLSYREVRCWLDKHYSREKLNGDRLIFWTGFWFIKILKVPKNWVFL